LDLLARNLRVERPRNRCPITLLIDDSTPIINPLYYFASQVPKNAVDYHYKKSVDKWYFDSDSNLKYPIPDTIDQEFVREFAELVDSNEVRGKISVIPYPGGLGRVDRSLRGFPASLVKDYVLTLRGRVTPKFDVSPEILTHTRAFNMNTKKMLNGISEHDWSQKQNSTTLTRYIAFALKILRRAGFEPNGVTSPCNFGLYVEEEYVKAVLDAVKQVLGLKVAWYFLHVDAESQVVDHRVMYLDRARGEAVVSLVGSMRDPFRSSQFTDMVYDSWVRENIDPILTEDGKNGRIANQIISGGCVTIMTHWQSLYSNQSRMGLKGLEELLTRINQNLNGKILWMKCSEIANYIACSSSVLLRPVSVDGKSLKIEIRSPFYCKDFTFSLELDSPPHEIALSGDAKSGGSKILEKVGSSEMLKPDSWFILEKDSVQTKIFVCLGELAESKKTTISYGVAKKTQKTLKKQEYFASVSIS
jgi:hypothetical protein